MAIQRTDPPVAADELTTLRGFLDHFRATLRRQAEGLDAEQLTRTVGRSDLALSGMLKHLTFVEHWWFEVMLHGREPSGIWADVDWDADEDWDWHSAVHDSPAELDAMLVEQVAASDAALEEALADGGLDRLAVRSRRGEQCSLRWILVHMVEEYARHCGHADLVRESIDGARDL
ncbi:DUF664 domain-containing protein [Nocardioides sp. zg-1308]|uniref:DinB family protein n=1 Tax=Nocardioides sp. zg-1308 TaxID=2736253 RepID=UPI0015527F8B|nr:DinB family protein [Nocardioides sp. zg-1308]NPD03629.1 DUF664 domain-containing protein [Nocardioides sp. zg-1308]